MGRRAERREQDRVNDREDRGVRADAERERKHGYESESGRLPELAKGVAEVVHGVSICRASL